MQAGFAERPGITVELGIISESSALRHSHTMQLAALQLDEASALRERSMLIHELDALPGSVRALTDQLNQGVSTGRMRR